MRSNKPTAEELTMIRDYVLLPHMLTIVQRSLDDIQYSSNVLKQAYSMVAQAIMNKISKDQFTIRRELTKRKIKIINDDEQVDVVVYHRFICRGYEERFGMMREVMRSQIRERLANYISEVVNKIKD